MTELYAPKEFWKLTESEKDQFRCGPGRGILEQLVPDKILGLSIRPACAIHDFMYSVAEYSIKAKEEADRVFLNNMIRLATSSGKINWLTRLRLRFVVIYYQAVKDFGGLTFWKNKNKPTEIGVV